MARKHEYDQHFLRSPRLVAELIGHSSIRRRDVVYDFGSGSGVISSVLARRAHRVVAVEHEAEALANLRRNLGSLQQVTIVDGDMLDVILPDESYKVFSNPPFSLSSPLLHRLVEADNRPRAIYLILQKQFALKLVPSNRHFTSALGITVASRYDARIRRPLKRTDFTPPPAVDTILLELKLRETPLVDDAHYLRFCKFVERGFRDAAFFAKLPRQEREISPERKPSELTPEQWVELYRAHHLPI